MSCCSDVPRRLALSLSPAYHIAGGHGAILQMVERISFERKRVGVGGVAEIVQPFGGELASFMVCFSASFEQGQVVRCPLGAAGRVMAKYEINFMKGMIDHHFMAVQMPQICVGKAVHEELRGLCQNIITTQQQELAERVSSPE